MPIFRQHRGGLKESLETSVIVHSKTDIINEMKKSPLKVYDEVGEEQIIIEDYGFDSRIGWFSQIVLLKTDENKYEINGVLGFLSEPLTELVNEGEVMNNSDIDIRKDPHGDGIHDLFTVIASGKTYNFIVKRIGQLSLENDLLKIDDVRKIYDCNVSDMIHKIHNLRRKLKMSCIQKLKELQGDKEFLKLNGRAVLESCGHYKGHDYCITFNDMGFRCAYVSVDRNSKYGSSRKLAENELDVHGSVTFHNKPHLLPDSVEKTCEDIWIGFDAGHYLDGTERDLAKQYFNIKESSNPFGIEPCLEGPVRTNKYMANECERLIDQICGEKK